MNKKLFYHFAIILLCLSANLYSQTYQLSGNPVNTTGWNTVPSATVNGDFIQLTPDQISKVGGITLTDPINLKYCNKWRVEFDFRIDRDASYDYRYADGIAFWYLANPPSAYVQGGGLGIPANATGLMVAFDVYNNSNDTSMSKVHVLYGTNNTANSNIEFNNTPGSTFHSINYGTSGAGSFIGSTFKHVEVIGEVDPANANNWIITVSLNGTQITSQSFAPSGGAIGMTQGYFGFSASTGASRARQSIKNVKIYTDKVSILQNTISQSFCPTGNNAVNLTSYNNQFVTNPADYTFTYYILGSSTPIANPANFQFNSTTTVSVVVKDNAGLLCDNPDGTIQLTLSPFNANDVIITECNNNNAGTAVFDLTSAAVTTTPGAAIQYYKTITDANTGTNPISNPSSYTSGETTIYTKVSTSQGCSDIAEITLKFYPEIIVNEATLESCFIETATNTAAFDLTSANVTNATSITKNYYTTISNAINGTNEITNPTTYVSADAIIYVKVTDTNGCYTITKITLKVLPPVTSAILKDKAICIDGRTDLDAGPGFDSYEWSNGATTQSISGISVGTYWVKLQTGSCYTLQTVNVYASAQPVISSIDIKNNTITVNTTGGTPPYQYSLNGINWQESNVFSNLKRGEVKVYVKDFYNCTPIEVQVTVPNLINAITPNGDNINDVIDYSALAYKKNLVFTIYNRYGNKLYEANKLRNYSWDGTSSGKKVPTGTYWYTITWNENDKNNTLTIYNGWVLVKNRK